MAEIKDFFIKESIIEEDISTSDYAAVMPLIKGIDIFSGTTYRNIYIIDYKQQNFLYVSDNPELLGGLSASEVKHLGYNFYLNYVAPEDLELLLEVSKLESKFFYELLPEEKQDYIISYDFHVINKECEKRRLVNHQITPLKLTENGQIWLALCIVSTSSNKKSGHIMALKKNSNEYLLFNRNTKRWQEERLVKLKSSEKDLIKLSARGFSMREIADRLDCPYDTVKSRQKNIFKKLGVTKMPEAIAYVKNYRLI
jgi:DNA-binding CsgD family transcriptional regulator